MFLDKHYRPLFLSLVPEGCQSAGVDECGFLLEVVAKIRKNPAFLVLHITGNPEILL